MGKKTSTDMNIQPIRNSRDHEAALKRVEQLWDAQANTIEEDELEILVTLIQSYEDKHYAISEPDPIEAIKFRMEQLNLSDNDLVPYLGQRSRVSEILNRKRRLNLNMIRKLHAGLEIPLSCLVREYDLIK